jgi:hypothetical protein
MILGIMEGRASEGQQQITALLIVVTERPTLPFVEEEAPFQST